MELNSQHHTLAARVSKSAPVPTGQKLDESIVSLDMVGRKERSTSL